MPLRTAAKIADDVSIQLSIDTGKHLFKHFSIMDKDVYNFIIEVINTARRELLEEAARRATVVNNCSVWNCEGESVNRQSILNLIKELK